MSLLNMLIGGSMKNFHYFQYLEIIFEFESKCELKYYDGKLDKERTKLLKSITGYLVVIKTELISYLERWKA
jgi:hypothetical protein